MDMDMGMDMDTITPMKKSLIDIHCHYIYDVDDGSKDIEMSEKLFYECYLQNIKIIFLTPHVNSSVSKANRESHIEKYNKLKPIAKKYNIELFLGAEIYIPFRIPNIDFQKYLMGNSNSILVEFATEIESPIIDHAYNLKHMGYEVIIAHVERYNYLTIEDLRELKTMGIYLQVNASSVIKKKNRYFSKKVIQIIKAGLIDFIATDAHNLSNRRPRLEEAYFILNKLIGSEKAKNLLYYNQKKLLLKT